MIQMSCLASPGGVAALPVPLQPAARVGQRALVLREAGGRKLEHLGLDLRGSTSLNSPWFSQNRAVSVSSGSMTTRNLSFDSAAVIFFLVRERHQRVEALADVAVDLALMHQFEGPQDVVGGTSSFGSQS